MATPEIKSLTKAFALLDCLAAQGGPASLPVLAKRCGLTVATAHRLLLTMEAQGAVVHIGPGEYAIGLRMLELSRRASFEGLLAASTAPVLSRITRSTGSTAHVGILDAENMVTYIARSASRHARIPTNPGNKLEAYCSGLGKVLLASLPKASRDAYLAEAPFPALTARTIVAPEALESELAAIGSRHFAIDDCEMFEDLRCVAVPIQDPAGRVVAALSASGTRAEMPANRVDALVVELTGHAGCISRKLFPASPAGAQAH
ncbi:MAG: IclR family transcriptional regulator [Sphingomonadales bacterium]|nr:IclR family transcriptional regulator [Sphingomonadales bacterium]